jgi:hypothetical protein
LRALEIYWRPRVLNDSAAERFLPVFAVGDFVSG